MSKKALYATDENSDIEQLSAENLTNNTARFFQETIIPTLQKKLEKNESGVIKKPFPECIDKGAWADSSHIKNSPYFNALSHHKRISKLEISGNMNSGWGYIEMHLDAS
jgi:hypothetical protein